MTDCSKNEGTYKGLPPCPSKIDISCVPPTTGEPSWTPAPDQLPFAYDEGEDITWKYVCETGWVASSGASLECPDPSDDIAIGDGKKILYCDGDEVVTGELQCPPQDPIDPIKTIGVAPGSPTTLLLVDMQVEPALATYTGPIVSKSFTNPDPNCPRVLVVELSLSNEISLLDIEPTDSVHNIMTRSRTWITIDGAPFIIIIGADSESAVPSLFGHDMSDDDNTTRSLREEFAPGETKLITLQSDVTWWANDPLVTLITPNSGSSLAEAHLQYDFEQHHWV